MSSRDIASRFSVVLSLSLIVAVVLAFVEKPERQPRIVPAAVPSSDKATAASILAQPELSATMPVVLPPPPAPEARRSPKAPATRPKESPATADIEQKPLSVKRPQLKEPGATSHSSTGKAGPSHPQTPQSQANAGRKPTRPAAQQKPDRPTRSTRLRSAAKGATGEEPAKSIVSSPSDVAEGRTLLRLLEHGSGPTIELAWPAAAGHRETLFALLGQCFGMRVALMDAGDHLYVAKGQPNTPWNLNLDRFSGFIREPVGEVSRQEREAAERIRVHHGGLVSALPVRVFPRTVDARLLGGLRRLFGESYATARAIRARYRVGGRRLFVEQITADGRPIRGRLELLPVARSACNRRVET